jgi:hypothetical protein
VVTKSRMSADPVAVARAVKLLSRIRISYTPGDAPTGNSMVALTRPLGTLRGAASTFRFSLRVTARGRKSSRADCAAASVLGAVAGA